VFFGHFPRARIANENSWLSKLSENTAFGDSIFVIYLPANREAFGRMIHAPLANALFISG
jgi:hypothetical protein